VVTRQDIHNSEIPLLCRACEARHRGVCGKLSEEQLVRLSKQTTRHQMRAGQEVKTVADGNARYANILSGVVKLSKLTSDGRQQIVGLQFAPDFLGRPMGRQPETMIEASTDVKVCSFPKAVIDDMMRQTPELEHKLHEQTLRELDEAREWLLTLGRKTAPERVAAFLCFLAKHSDPEGADNAQAALTLELPMTRAEIADFLGLTIETVSRQVTRLRQSGTIVLRDNRTVDIPNLEKLQALADGEA
jgi:CRP/FNR family transcriptional regulator, anaerobic regulatory protein